MRHPWPDLARRGLSLTRWTVGALVAVALFAPPRAHAQIGLRLDSPGSAARPSLGRALGHPVAPPPTALAPSGWTFDLAAVTSLPLSVGAEATLTTPIGLFAQLSLGHTPQAYLGVVAGALGDADVYPDEMDEVVGEAIASGAWNLRAGLGFTIPEGLELSVGYTWLTASSELSPAAVEVALGQRVRWSGMTEVPITVNIHALYGRIGWRFVVEDQFVIRASIGWTHAVSSETHVDVPDELRDPPDDPATQMEIAVADALSQYGYTPEVLLSAGYRF